MTSWSQSNQSGPISAATCSLTSVQSNRQVVKELQKVGQLRSRASNHCEFHQVGRKQTDEEQEEEQHLYLSGVFLCR